MMAVDHLVKSCKGLRPLVVDGARIICQQRNNLVTLNVDTGDLITNCTLPGSMAESVFRRFSLVSRLTRSNCLWGVQVQDGILFSTRAGVFHLDSGGGVRSEFVTNGRAYFLDVSTAEGIPGFRDGLYAGEYLSNPAMEEVSIWFRNPAGQWDIVHTFPAGAVNHVHALIPDPDHDCIWILTGDFGTGPIIWRARNGFEEVEPVHGPDQKARACWMMPLEGSLVWASDTQLEPNAVYRALATKDGEIVKVADIAGSSIYSARLDSGMLFSTVMEPERASRRNLLAWLSAKPAAAIENHVSVCFLGHDGAVREIRQFRARDIPYRLFEYPTVLFPKHVGATRYVAMYCRTLKGVDDTMLVFSRDLLSGGVVVA